MEKVKLGQLTNIKTGRLDVNAENPNGKYPFFTCSKNHTYIDEYAFDGESVLVAGNGDLNVKYYNGKFNAYQRTYVIQANENLNGKFLYYFLDSYVEKLREQSIGGVIKYIKLGNLTDAEIPLPPLATQQRIATILDQANAIIQNNRGIVQKYDALTQSLFLEMFGDIKSNSKNWDLKPFEYFAKFDTKMTSDFEKYADKPHIGIANIEKETGKLVDYKLISEENLSSGKYIFDESHIIYSKIRPNLNKVALPNFSGLCSADSYPLKVISKNTNRIFFAYVLRSDSFVDFILTHSTRTNIPKANKEQMKKYIGIAPPIELQNQFAERVAVIEAQKQQAQLALSKSEALFLSLLQRDFKGELN